MRTSEIKKKIIQKISNSDNKELLSDIYELLRDESKKEILLLSDEQNRLLKIAEKQIAKGEFFTEKEAKARTKAWLGK